MKTFFSLVLLSAVVALSAGNSFAGFVPIGGKTCPPEQSICQPPPSSSETSEIALPQPEAGEDGAVFDALYDGFAGALDLIF